VNQDIRKGCQYCKGTGRTKGVVGYVYNVLTGAEHVYQEIQCPACKMRDEARLLRLRADAMDREADSIKGGRS
jgi:hypothetical protein